MLVCSPVPVAAWAKDPLAVLAAFGPDVALVGGGEAGAPLVMLAVSFWFQPRDNRSITACGTGVALIVPPAGSPCTHTRVSNPSTARAPFLLRRWRTSKLERRNSATVVSIETSSP